MRAIQDLLDGSMSHERVAEDVAPALTTMGRVALGVLAVEVLLLRSPPGGIVPTFAVHGTELGLFAALVVAVATRGFRRASVAGQATVLALPLVALVPVISAIGAPLIQ